MATLTRHDVSILAKIKDPEANVAPSYVKADSSLPPDPNLSKDEYQDAKELEANALKKLMKRDSFGFPLEPSTQDLLDLLDDLEVLVERHPNYSSARNNRVQAIRTIYGDDLLVKLSQESKQINSLDNIGLQDRRLKDAATLALQDLTTAINLLSVSPEIPISTRSAQTLANLHTQKATIYNTTSKLLNRPNSKLRITVLEKSKDGRELELRGSNEFEDQAHRNFSLGAWYGNELAEKMVPVTNPMAKLCGEIVSNAMKKEIEGYRD
ncbi:hypothetical protein B0O99DRAFT_627584 [Bisporella sp. PMI_857]|nr:hypothetical protein B0O99DRAFT_627584 [Bisporella sp. PMI_857]